MSPRILAIDDNAAFCDLVRDVLTQAGCDVRTAHTGEEGLDLAAQGADLIILDIGMSDMDGWEVLKRLKAVPKTAGIPVVICSTQSERDNIPVAQSLGAVDYIHKPFGIQDFSSRIKKAMSHGR